MMEVAAQYATTAVNIFRQQKNEGKENLRTALFWKALNIATLGSKGEWEDFFSHTHHDVSLLLAPLPLIQVHSYFLR